MFQREDWTLFRSLGTLSQKAGVPLRHLRRLVIKEMMDNALDADPTGNVEMEKVGRNGYWVSDSGPGIAGGGEVVANLFSIGRPLTSSKLLRLPVRGALGNGLRVVVGAVLASGGKLEVTTAGTHYKLQPLDDGTTEILEATRTREQPKGTRVFVEFGEGLPTDADDMYWAKLAKNFSYAKQWSGRSHAVWFDSDSFYEVLQAAGNRTIEQLLLAFEGFGDGKKEVRPSDFVGARFTANRLCSSLDRTEAEELLGDMREQSADTAPAPQKIGHVGAGGHDAYGKAYGTLEIKPARGKHSAMLPFIAEAWAWPRADDEKDDIDAMVNGTPIAGEMRLERHKATKLAVFGCGLRHYLERVPKRKFNLRVNVTTPFMPVTTDGKEPDFSRYLDPMNTAITKATKKLRASIRRQENSGSQTEVILRHIEEGVAQASGNGMYRYSLRQLYYAVRPHVLAADSERGELNYDWFCRVVTRYENEQGELVGMYRDPRGTLYHPHLRQSIPLGTLAVEEYKRPAWTINKILYCEKEGFINLLQSVGWPERRDCALVSSKGFASRAVRDVLDILGDTDEEITFFCIHDADASGTLIYETLQQGTSARAARRVKIINLGLDPWEAIDMGLQPEAFTVKGGRKLPVAEYVKDYDSDGPALRPPGGDRRWQAWLQGNRVELNAMTSPQFLEWLDNKVDQHDTGKVVPPATVLREQLRADTESVVRQNLAARILRENGIDALVAQAMAEREQQLTDTRRISRTVENGLDREPEQRWTDPLRKLAEQIAKIEGNGDQHG